MPSGAMESVVHYLRQAAGRRTEVCSDGELLEAFLASGDGTAFEQLVRRHGPMVLGVCRRVLGNVHDAEDAFQATFLVLARKGRSVVPRERVGSWLHGVALRTALEARARRARRWCRERQVTAMPHPAVVAEVDREALHRLLDQELSRLPAKYRTGIILCDLEGRSRKEAARQMGVPEGTLSSRLATGRQMLARRLARQGVSVPAAALATILVSQAAAAVRPALFRATAQAALSLEAGQAAVGLVSAPVLSLTHGVLKTMLLSKLKIVSVLVLALAVGGLGAGLVGSPGKGDRVARAQSATGAGPRGAAEPDEPLEGRLLLDPQIHKELRLSKNQVQRLQETASAAEQKNAGTRQEIKQLQEQIAQLQKRIAELQGQTGKLREKATADRDQALRRAAPDILSARAIQRLRQIQRQRRGAEQLLNDPRVQRLLQLDDEQMMKIDKVMKEQQWQPWAPNGQDFNTVHFLRLSVSQPLLLKEIYQPQVLKEIYQPQVLTNLRCPALHNGAVSRLADILTEEQKRTLRSLLGEPYESNPPDWLKPRRAKKDR